MVGYSLSFIVLVFALATFCYFRYVSLNKAFYCNFKKLWPM
jgi:hypothetical protein